jgi:hypothetical protein
MRKRPVGVANEDRIARNQHVAVALRVERVAALVANRRLRVVGIAGSRPHAAVGRGCLAERAVIAPQRAVQPVHADHQPHLLVVIDGRIEAEPVLDPARAPIRRAGEIDRVHVQPIGAVLRTHRYAVIADLVPRGHTHAVVVGPRLRLCLGDCRSEEQAERREQAKASHRVCPR